MGVKDNQEQRPIVVVLLPCTQQTGVESLDIGRARKSRKLIVDDIQNRWDMRGCKHHFFISPAFHTSSDVQDIPCLAYSLS